MNEEPTLFEIIADKVVTTTFYIIAWSIWIICAIWYILICVSK